MQNVVCIPAKVPIVKMFDPIHRFACDIGINNSDALENTRMIKVYMDVDRRVRPLAMIIKYWTKRRVLNESATGMTLSSYTWINLIVNFLQVIKPPVLPSLQARWHEDNPGKASAPGSFNDERWWSWQYGINNHDSLAQLLFRFFRYYGHEFDWENSVASVRTGKTLSKSEKSWHLVQNNRLCVEEPFNTSRNLANTAEDSSVRGIQLEIRRAFDTLSSSASLDELCRQYEFPPQKVYGDQRTTFRAKNFGLHQPTGSLGSTILRSNSQGRNPYEKRLGATRSERRASTITEPFHMGRRASTSASFDPASAGHPYLLPYLGPNAMTGGQVPPHLINTKVALDLHLIEQQKKALEMKMASNAARYSGRLDRANNGADLPPLSIHDTSSHHYRSDSIDAPTSAPLRQSQSFNQLAMDARLTMNAPTTRTNHSNNYNHYSGYNPRRQRFSAYRYPDPYRPKHFSRSRSQPPQTSVMQMPFQNTMSILPNGQIISHPPLPELTTEALQAYQNAHTPAHHSLRRKTSQKSGQFLDPLGLEYLGYLHQQARARQVAQQVVANGTYPPLTPTIPVAYPLHGLDGPFGLEGRADYQPSSVFTTPMTRSRPTTPPTTALPSSSSQTPLESSTSTLHSDLSTWPLTSRSQHPTLTDTGQTLPLGHYHSDPSFRELRGVTNGQSRPSLDAAMVSSSISKPDDTTGSLVPKDGQDNPVVPSGFGFSIPVSSRDTIGAGNQVLPSQLEVHGQYKLESSSDLRSTSQMLGNTPPSPASFKTSHPLSPVAEQTLPLAQNTSPTGMQVSPPKLPMSFRDSVLRRATASPTGPDVKSTEPSSLPPALKLERHLKNNNVDSGLSLEYQVTGKPVSAKQAIGLADSIESYGVANMGLPFERSTPAVDEPVTVPITSLPLPSITSGLSPTARSNPAEKRATLAEHLRHREHQQQHRQRPIPANTQRSLGELQPPPTPLVTALELQLSRATEPLENLDHGGSYISEADESLFCRGEAHFRPMVGITQQKKAHSGHRRSISESTVLSKKRNNFAHKNAPSPSSAALFANVVACQVLSDPIDPMTSKTKPQPQTTRVQNSYPSSDEDGDWQETKSKGRKKKAAQGAGVASIPGLRADGPISYLSSKGRSDTSRFSTKGSHVRQESITGILTTPVRGESRPAKEHDRKGG